MEKPKQYFFTVVVISLVLLITVSCELSSALKDEVRVGVILDMESEVGRRAERWISMAHTHFYAENAHYRTRLNLLTRDSKSDIVVAASQALDLMKNEEVHAIIGPQRSAQAKFVINLGQKAEVPIISFSATSPALSPTENPFFIRTAHADSFQVRAIADIVNAYGWKEVIPIYEDTDYGNGLIPYLNDAFQKYNIRVPYRSVISLNSKDSKILKELNKLKQYRTTIFVVHMTASLGSRLFIQANKADMMSEGYAWIVTQGLSTLLDPIEPKVMDSSMQGVLGLRPHIPMSKRIKNITARSSKVSNTINGLNLFGLWAYDTVWALAMAVEKAGVSNSSFLKPNATSRISTTRVDLASLGKSETGIKLLDTIVKTKFDGLSGKFHLVRGELEPLGFEIFNVMGENVRIIGYWTQETGLLADLNNNSKANMNELLKKPLWPGNTLEQPKKLQIGVPVKKGFTEFVKVEFKTKDGKPKFSGYSIEVFKAVQEVLEFPLRYDFVPYEGVSYTDLLKEIPQQKFDAVVADTTIVASRSTFVDFTLPYSESGVSMVVLVKDDERKNFWIFLKPFSWDLWLTTGLAFVFTGLVVWVLEHRVNTDFRGPPEHQVGTIFWFSFSTLVFAHRERVMNNWSRFVLIIWVFVVLILTQSYTASLTSMLTVQLLQPRFADVKEIRDHGYFVGYQNDSFVKDLLTKQLNFDEHKLIGYNTEEEYHLALSTGKVAAIFDEIPYIKLFLGKSKNCSKYMMVGPTYRTDGLGFAFPQGSPLVSNISRAILNVTENDSFSKIEEETLGVNANCEGLGATLSSDGSHSLSVYSFAGLFIITGAASMSSLVIYTINFVYSQWPLFNDIHPERSTPFWSKVVHLIKNFDKKDLSSHPFKRYGSRVHPSASPQGTKASPDTEDMQNHSRIDNGETETVDRN